MECLHNFIVLFNVPGVEKGSKYLIYGSSQQVLKYCDMMPEGRNSGARGDVHC
jgi:hypothetical protein